MATLIIGRGAPLTIEEIGLLASREAAVNLNEDSKFLDRIAKGPILVEHLDSNGHAIYTVNTGVGSNCTVHIPKELRAELSEQIVACYGCGFGKDFDLEETRAIVAARVISLARGYSGVRIDILRQLVLLLQKDILPRIPQEGSVGASGDLVPLSYIAGVLCGKRDVYNNGTLQKTHDVFLKEKIQPLTLQQKEGVALLNGTSAMTGVACLVWLRAQYICKLATRITSLAILALDGNLTHYDETLFLMKPHLGQQTVAARIRQDLMLTAATPPLSAGAPVQDRYSLRCAPQIIGVLEDALPFFKHIIESELNSTNDNPLFDVESGRVFHGGMFYGGHIAFVMDSMKTLVANLADLMDRQMAQLANPTYSRGLPPNLSGMTGIKTCVNHGLKGLEICSSALTAEALKNTMPASVFSRSTENHVQDKVSMGSIAARDCTRVLELTERVAAVLLVAVRQGLALREKLSGEKMTRCSIEVSNFVEGLNKEIDFIVEDVPLDSTLGKITEKIKTRSWNLYDE